MNFRFQSIVYNTLLKDVGLPWDEIEKKFRKAMVKRDILVAAKIRTEISNLVEMCVRIDKDAVIVKGFEEPLVQGDLFLHPLSKELCVVGKDGAAPRGRPRRSGDTDILRKLTANIYLCKRLGTWFKIDYRFKVRYEHFNQPAEYFGHVDFLKDGQGLTYVSEALTDDEVAKYKLVG